MKNFLKGFNDFIGFVDENKIFMYIYNILRR